MKKVALALLLALTATSLFAESITVKGYTRKDGTIVKEHLRGVHGTHCKNSSCL
jgi:hypothetical protein